MTYSERSTPRLKYDAAISTILRDFRSTVVVALKQSRGTSTEASTLSSEFEHSISIVFVGQSFAEKDAEVNEPIKRFIRAYGLTVTTGEKPEADSVSAKVRDRIEAAQLFVGVFTRRDKLAGRAGWAASPWVVDEKAYALAKNKRLILIKEEGVKSVGGLQGDYEYLEFRRDELADLLIRLLETLKSTAV